MKMNMQIINKILEEKKITKYDLLMECAGSVMMYCPDYIYQIKPELRIKNEIVIELWNEWKKRKVLN